MIDGEEEKALILKLIDMKKTITVLSLVAGLVMNVGIMFKVLHWPGGAYSLLAATVLFVIAGILLLVHACKSSEDKAYKMCGALVEMLAPVTMLFVILYWPWRGTLIMITAGLLVPVYLIWSIVRACKK